MRVGTTSPPTEKVSKWTPTTDLMMLRRMGKLTEELGELAAVTARCIIQGIDEVDPSSGDANRLRLEKEIADVYAQLDETVARLELRQDFILDRRCAKREAMHRWEAMFVNDSSGEPRAERDLDQAMKERDEAEEMADKLSDAISELTGCAIGEHSSGNCPWQNALYAAEEMGQCNPAQLLVIAECASQLEVDYTADDDMETIEGFDRLRECLRPWRASRSSDNDGR